MVFSSPIFLFLFLPLCLISYLVVNRFFSIKIRNLCLLFFSIIFYAYGSLDFLPILILSIIINYYLTHITYNTNDKKVKRILFIITITFNILMLFIYKYCNLFTELFFGADHATHIKLPIGISFYTFQVLSYVIDAYRKDVKPCDNIFDFALFVMLFPQLIAGPIVRYSSIMKELKNRKTTLESFTNGLKRFMVGFAKKILFANSLGRIADLAFYNLSNFTMGPLLSSITIICYSIQIYLDFFAYSDMAIGIGQIFGFSFPENFNMPFISKSISEFWNRWHITLSTFFRDYVYIPLGGNRKGLLRTCLNLTIVFTLSGFWHGASFNFLFWGLYNALFLVIERIIKAKTKFKMLETTGIIYTFVVWNIGMILFRLDNIEDIKLFIYGFFNQVNLNYSSRELINAIYNLPFFITFSISILYLTPIFDKINNILNNTKFGFIIVDIIVITLFIYSVIEMLTTGFNPFIYFRF